MVVMIALSGPAPSSRFDVDDDELEEQRALAKIAIRENCLICHSEELIASQRLTPVQWKATVEKMVDWGSPLPADQRASTIAYLSTEYGPSTPPRELVRLKLPEAAEPVTAEEEASRKLAAVEGDAGRGLKLYMANCANCHGTDGQGAELGSNLVERVILLRPKDYAAVVRQGRGRMPGFTTVLDATGEADILAWLRSRRYMSLLAK
jgi:hypothetical protein